MKPATYRMPAEWEEHEATWLAWPHELGDWPGKFAPIPWVYADIVRLLARVERVRILVQGREAAEKARRYLTKVGADIGAVEFYACPTNRSWVRDYGPVFVRDKSGHLSAVNWKFNAWAKYTNWQLDDAVPNFIAERLSMKLLEPGAVLEGGGIDVNGRGSLLTTEECLLSPIQGRNPSLDRGQMEALMARYLGAVNVLWLNRGIEGDDTHGHIDDIARFAGPSTVVAALESDPQDPNYEPLRENFARLRRMRDEAGNALRIISLPMPDPIYFDRQRLPASYLNFYIANRLVLVPTFNDAKDRIALGTLARVFPQHSVVGVHSLDLVLGLGTLHCMTQQQPAASTGL